ncbi:MULTISPECIES: hypothetical protein [Halobacillus]|nr:MULTISPECIES: hypothetical protein [Halobacillus]
MGQSERSTIIEWLYVITGTPRSFWKNYDSDVLDRLFVKTIEDHQAV